MPQQQSYGQKVLHTERKSTNPFLQQFKEEAAQTIDILYEQDAQTTDLNVKECIMKAVMNFKLGFDNAERAFNVQPQSQEQNGNYAWSNQRQSSRQEQPA